MAQLINTSQGISRSLKLTLVTEMAQAEELMRWLGERRSIMGVDTETGGLDYWREPLRMVQVGDSTHGWALPYPEWGGLAKQVIDRYDREIVMHNAKFDMHFLARAGFKLDRTKIHDTRILAHLLDNDNLTGLKYLASKYIDRSADFLEQQLSAVMAANKWGWPTVPTDHPAYWQYAAMDPVLTAGLYDLMVDEVAQDYRYAYDIELTAQQVLMDMEFRGIRVDVPYAQALMLNMWERCDQLALEVHNEYEVGIGSNDKVAGILNSQGAGLWKRTTTGKFSLDEEVLLAIDHPLARKVLEHRHLTKIANTYLKNFVDLVDDESFLHPSLNLLGAKTGRMSVSRPSLQNLERTADVRNSFIPREGNTLLLVDYDQIEMRLFCHYCKSDALVKAFHPDNDLDGFTETARMIHRDPTLEKKDPRRQTTKNAWYAKIYGAGVGKFAITAGISDHEAGEIFNRMTSTYPEIDDFIKGVEDEAKIRLGKEGVAYVRGAYGNRRLVLHETKKLYKLVNYLIQGTAAQVLKERIVSLEMQGLAEYLVLPVHDELVFDVPAELADELGVEISRAMSVTDRFAVPLTTEVRRVDRWGDVYPPSKFLEALNATS